MEANMESKIKSVTEELLKKLDVNAGVVVAKQPHTETSEEGVETYDVIVEGDDLSFLIGTRGYTLDNMQNVIGLIMYKQTGSRVFANLDINGYKVKKEEKIYEMVKRYIDKVRFFQKDVELPPMSPWERRLVHMFVREYADVVSESTGEGQTRHIILTTKKD